MRLVTTACAAEAITGTSVDTAAWPGPAFEEGRIDIRPAVTWAGFGVCGVREYESDEGNEEDTEEMARHFGMRVGSGWKRIWFC